MLRLVNVVGTRAVRGEHDALVRWYADHVHMLMAFDGLHGAALHRRVGNEEGAPQYLCFYDFADRAAFEAYEHSDVHKNASHDRAQGWGRDGIEITLRSQFERLYQRHARAAAATQPHWQVEAWQSPQEPSLAIERALADCAGSESALALLRTTEWPSKVADYLTLTPQPLATAAPPALNLRWQGAYELLLQWSR